MSSYRDRENVVILNYLFHDTWYDTVYQGYTGSTIGTQYWVLGILFCNNSTEICGGAILLGDSNMTLTGSVVFMANET